MNTRQEQLNAFNRLLDIMDELREKCPWDQKQTFQSLSHLTIEEVYELTDAIRTNDLDEIKKELGDVIMHIVFYAKIASESQSFDIGDVIHSICDKLIVRHPHIYGNSEVKTEEEVLKDWELIKLDQGNQSVLGGVPKSLPAMIKAFRIQDKAKGVGFDWDRAEDVWKKVEEELQEFQHEVKANDKQKMKEEFGDVLFSLINYARFKNINPEEALATTNDKFIRRFQLLEQLLTEDKLVLVRLTIVPFDIYWEKAKKNI